MLKDTAVFITGICLVVSLQRQGCPAAIVFHERQVRHSIVPLPTTRWLTFLDLHRSVVGASLVLFLMFAVLISVSET